MEKKVVKKTVLKEEELVKVVGGKKIFSGYIGIDFLHKCSIFRRKW